MMQRAQLQAPCSGPPASGATGNQHAKFLQPISGKQIYSNKSGGVSRKRRGKEVLERWTGKKNRQRNFSNRIRDSISPQFLTALDLGNLCSL